MDETNKLAEIDRKLDAILAALAELLAIAPRANAEWYQEQTQAGQREVPTAENRL